MKKSITAVFCIMTLMLSLFVFESPIAEAKPYKKHVLPGYILAADFDDGEEGVTYSPLTVAKTGNYNYRAGYNLNFWHSTEKGKVAMSFNTGEWLLYTVEVSEDGEYEAVIRYATPGGAAVFKIYVDDKLAISKNLDSTGSFTETSEQSLGTMKLTVGTHTMKFEMVASGMNFNYVTFTNLSAKGTDTSKKEGAYRYTAIPAIIEAEDYDLGEAGCYSKTSKNQGKKYRPNDKMDVYGNDGAYYVRYTNEEYTVYTYNVTKSGIYDLSAYTLSDGGMDFYFDNSLNPVSAKLKTGDNAVVSIWLDKGEHMLKCKATGSIDLDSVRFLNSSAQSYITVSDLNKEAEIVEEKEEVRKIYKELFVSPSGSDENDGSFDTPFKTIEKAKEAVKLLTPNQDGDIVVNIMPGYYFLSETLKFDETDSGKDDYKVIYKGYNSFDKPVLGGGIRITDWQKQANGIWKADASNVTDTRHLFVNGMTAQRARSKYTYVGAEYYTEPDSQYEKDGFTLSKNNFPNLQKPQDAELLWDLYWTSQRTPVKDVAYDGDNVNIILDQPSFNRSLNKNNKTTSPSTQAVFYIENDLGLLDEEGEFYFDKDTKQIYYLPFPEEDMETAETYVSVTEFLVKAEGASNKNRVENLEFNNLSFKYGEWHEVGEFGLVIEQADQYFDGVNNRGLRGNYMIPAQTAVNNAKNINFIGCEFKNMGSGALSMVNSVSDCKIQGNIFTDIGGSGIVIGHWDHVNTMPDGVDRTTNIEICDNVIRRAAQSFNSTCGISVYYVSGVNIHHNDLKDLPYTGITMGWGWEAEDIVSTGNNHIDYNRIVDVMENLKDGGSIYTLGPIRNSTIIGNYCVHNEDASGSIYLDQGSAHLTVSDNVVLDSKLWLNARPGVNIRGITASNNYTDNSASSLDTSGVSISSTTVVDADKLPDGAKAIIELSGVRDKYKNLLNGAELPTWRTNFFLSTPKSFFSGLNGWIEAEDYMTGGAEVAFHKEGNVQQVVTYQQGIRTVIGNTAAGEWTKYEVEVEKSGNYRIDVLYSNAFPEDSAMAKTRVYMDDKVIIEGADCPSTGSWSTYEVAELGYAYIKEGKHTFKIEFVDNAYSFDSWRLYDESVVIEGENDPLFDEGIYKPKPREKEFMDMKGHWAENTVKTLYEKGIINGVSDTLCAPDENVSVYQAAWLIMRTMGIEYNDANWKEIAFSNGLLQSLDENDGVISRERIAAQASRLYIANENEYTLNYVKNPFTDTALISPEYAQDVINAYGLGIVKGDTAGAFNPHNGLTRAEAAAVIYNLYSIIK